MPSSHLQLTIEFEISWPLKLPEREKFNRHILSLFAEKGARELAIIDSSYWLYKWPNKPKIYEVNIKFDGNVKTTRNICDSILDWTDQYYNKPRIWIRNGNTISEFKREGTKKGRICILNSGQTLLKSAVIVDTITTSEYGEES